MNDRSTYVGLGERMSQRMAPTCDWTDMGPDEHFVQFFESDDFIVNEVAEYVIHGSKCGETCIVVATREHLADIERIVDSCSYGIERAREEGRLVMLDAEATLEKILTKNRPDRHKFTTVIGTLIGNAAERGQGIRVFGEMVGILCSRGRYDAAVELEGFWNDLRKEHNFSLFCAYSMAHLANARGRMESICTGHDRVIPSESYSSIIGTNERLKHIATLQQRTKQLQAEIAELEHRIAAREDSVEPSMVPLAV